MKMHCAAPSLGRSTVGGLSRLQERLDQASTVGELFAAASREALGTCGYDRALVLDVDEGCVTVQVTGPLTGGSEELRLRLIGSPLRVSPLSYEAGLLRGDGRMRADAESLLESKLGLDEPGFATIAPEGSAVALLVADRPGHDSADAQTVLSLLAHLVGCSLTRFVLRARLDELSSELRYLTASASALLHEARHAPIEVPRDRGSGPAFRGSAGLVPLATSVEYGLTSREAEVLRLMARGLANGEIATHLNLSQETVKSHVRGVLRKLGAANRVEAVVRHLQQAGN